MQRLEKNNRNLKFYFITFFLPMVMIGWMGSAIRNLPFFTDNTRWLLLFIMCVFLYAKPILFKFLDQKFVFILSIYCAWCMFTTAWSTIPLLSFMKSGLYLLLIPTLIFTGIEWVRRNSDDKILNYLWLFSFVTIVCAFSGKKSIDPEEYYSGMMKGSNMLGFMIAASAPYCFWKTYQTFRKKIFYFYLVLSGCCFYFSFLSMSRAAILMVLMIALSMLFNLNLNKKLFMLISVIFVGIGVIAFNPSLIDNTVLTGKKYLFKNQQTVFHSRLKPWEDSYEGATEGGWTGLGFGVAFGNYNFELGNRLSAKNYGREKGNSQLAIIEETGLIGFALYLILISYIFFKLILLRFNSHNQNQRVIAGILTGTFLGMLLTSVFEAWWFSPGSPESIYFWVLIGVIRGFEISIANKRITYVNSKMEA